MVESEFGHHEDGLPSLSEDADETKRLAERRRKHGKEFLATEDVPSTEPDPLERLIRAEEANGLSEDGKDQVGEEGVDTSEIIISPVQPRKGEIKVDERTIVYGGEAGEYDPKNDSSSDASRQKRNLGKDPKYKDVRR